MYVTAKYRVLGMCFSLRSKNIWKHFWIPVANHMQHFKSVALQEHVFLNRPYF